MSEKVKSPLLQKAFDDGKDVYSYSKLNTFNSCELEYFKSYIEKQKGKDNIYTVAGSVLHDLIESIYKDEITNEEMKKSYHEKMTESELLGYKFPSESIKDSWEKDINHFIYNFAKIDSKFILEKHMVFDLTNQITLQGYIDALQPSEKGKPYINVIDWKSSSKFSGKKLKDAGRQLIMYKLAIESTTNYKVDKLMWFMMKYMNICWKLKNGKIKKKMVSRGKWVKEMKNQLTKDLKELQLDDFEIELMLDESIADNSMSNLPQQVQDKYTFEDCFVEYEVTDEDVEEFKMWVIDTVKEIKSKSNLEEEWKPIEITKFESFYCSNLCGHKSTCHAYKRFIEENADGFEKKENKVAKDEFDDLF